MREIKPGFPVNVPRQTLLLIFKLKAAWDRLSRLENSISSRLNNEEWEKSKLIKDRADILSLIDPNKSGTDIDVQYLGEKLHEYSFLVDMLRGIPGDKDAIDKYGLIGQEEARDFIEKLLLLAIGRRDMNLPGAKAL